MAFPLQVVLNAAPQVVAAAVALATAIREWRGKGARPDAARMEELAGVIERQARIIEELAENNRSLALAVRNNRLLAIAATAVAAAALLVAALR